MHSTVNPNRADLELFFNAIFRYADPDSFVSLRAYEEGKGSVSTGIEAVRLDRPDLLDRIYANASQAAREPAPAVFCPPIATFQNGKNATTENIANGLDICAELDERPRDSLAMLVPLLGPATVLTESGGEWPNPETGELEPKLHAHWRLKEPTRTPEDHTRLRKARELVVKYVGGDETVIPIVHPVRWPGSVHRKQTPRLSRVVDVTENEVEVDDVIEAITLVMPVEEIPPAKPGAGNSTTGGTLAKAFATGPYGLPGDIASALAVIPNDNLSWPEWNYIGMAAWRASDGEAFEAFDTWSQKSAKYDAAATAERWKHLGKFPPSRIGSGTLYYLAGNVDPAWTKPSAGKWKDTVQSNTSEKTERNASAEKGSNVLSLRLEIEQHPDMTGFVGYDEFAARSVLLKPIPDPLRKSNEPFTSRPWQDLDDIRLAVWFQSIGYKRASREQASAVAELVANTNRFHPVQDYLAGLRWQGVPLLDSLLDRGFGAVWETPEQAKFLKAVSRRWMISAVARAMAPGSKADTTLILQGAQGVGKSSGIRALCPDPAWFADSLPADLGSKDARSFLQGHWLIELPEIAQFKRSESETLKSFLTCAEDRFRPAYGKAEVSRPRGCVFAGTTNADEFLTDPSGARRFAIARVKKVDVAWIEANRDQLWAEALRAYRANEQWWLNDEEAKLAAAENEERAVVDAWEEVIEGYVQGLKMTSIPSVLFNALKIEMQHHRSVEQTRVASCLKRLGWVSKTVRDGDSVKRRWVPEAA